MYNHKQTTPNTFFFPPERSGQSHRGPGPALPLYEQHRELSDQYSLPLPSLVCVLLPKVSRLSLFTAQVLSVHIILTSVLLSFIPISCPVTFLVVKVEWGPGTFLFPLFVISDQMGLDN